MLAPRILALLLVFVTLVALAAAMRAARPPAAVAVAGGGWPARPPALQMRHRAQLSIVKHSPERPGWLALGSETGRKTVAAIAAEAARLGLRTREFTAPPGKLAVLFYNPETASPRDLEILGTKSWKAQTWDQNDAWGRILGYVCPGYGPRGRVHLRVTTFVSFLKNGVNVGEAPLIGEYAPVGTAGFLRRARKLARAIAEGGKLGEGIRARVGVSTKRTAARRIPQCFPDV